MNPPPTLYPGLHLPAYYEMEGTPVRITHPLGLPERLRLGGKWETFNDPYWEHKADRIDEKEFNELVARYDR
jgi:hypothetical protein